MAFYVSRQRDNADNRLFVEIACGGSKKAGPDALTARYEGEGKNLVNPKDAVNVAERIYKKWDRDYPDETKSLRIVLSADLAHLIYSFNKKDLASAHNWADKMLLEMAKCGACAKPMGNRALFESEHIAGKVFCSEVCVARKYRDMYGEELPGQLDPRTKKKTTKK